MLQLDCIRGIVFQLGSMCGIVLQLGHENKVLCYSWVECVVLHYNWTAACVVLHFNWVMRIYYANRIECMHAVLTQSITSTEFRIYALEQGY